MTITISANAHESHAHPIETSVWDAFAKQVYQTPNAPALIELTSNGVSTAITYQDIFQEAQAIADLLQDAGVRPGEIVAFRLNRGRAALTAILGIVASGAAYLPLDPEWPQVYQNMQLLDAHVRLLLVEAPPQTSHPIHIEQVIHASMLRAENAAKKIQAEVASSSSAPSHSPYGSEQLLYVLYTSGTTGKPKGVRIPHRAVLARFLHPDYLPIRPGQYIAHCASLTFDASTFEIWGTLLNGGCLVSFPKELVLAGQAFFDALKQHHISVLFLTTALFHRYARQFPDGFSDLEAVLFGGEATDTSAIEALLASHPPRRLLHMYGPTENTVFSAWYEVDTFHPLAEYEKPLPIGQALPASSCYVLDDQQREVLPGEDGELYVGGDGLALGYLNRSDSTRERFLDDVRFGRLYRTGDIVRAQPDGNLIFIGRRDGQVKLRGLCIELEAIENILRGHPAVQDVACSVEGSGEQAMLVAFLVFQPTAKQDGQSVSDLLASFRALFAMHPSYLIPGRFYRVPDLPLTTNGKRDRSLLIQSAWRDNVQPSLLTGASSSSLLESTTALASQASATSLHRALHALCAPCCFSNPMRSQVRLSLTR
ncbi:amino acid adenylation domain-containing protein [Ktedonospora formicarum]|uniref:Non-ribosomal peptide synthetase n=1 Tax=Ktedonospora formicarum TaxID=2778364 RepID=A0A8J3I9D1_9CHLR|nr:amino acid adenylation domain-containing protein [Ktedonospora formicarum]GHO49230.1 hypothetical protein KSX_73930 [Ktedonospora formicarum]